MGGRGGYSMTGALSASASGMTDAQIDEVLSSLRAQRDLVGGTLEGLAHDKDVADRRGDWDGPARTRYYDALSKYQALRDRVWELEDEQRARTPRASRPKESRTFVNSYGEATTRYVTSPTYERAQRRLRRAVARNMGAD